MLDLINLDSLLSALIGGVFALLGVLITIIWERTTRNKIKMEDGRPFFGFVDSVDTRTLESQLHTFIFTSNGKYDHKLSHIYGSFVNSEKVEFLIEKISIEGKIYYPESKIMVLKGMAFMIRLNHEETCKINDMFMYVLDINHNKRKYKLKLTDNLITDIVEITR